MDILHVGSYSPPIFDYEYLKVPLPLSERSEGIQCKAFPFGLGLNNSGNDDFLKSPSENFRNEQKFEVLRVKGEQTPVKIVLRQEPELSTNGIISHTLGKNSSFPSHAPSDILLSDSDLSTCTTWNRR